MGLFDRLKQRLVRTRETLSDGITGLFRGGRPIDQALLDKLSRRLLYTSDLGPVAAIVRTGAASPISARAHKRGEVRGEDDVRAALKKVLCERLAQEQSEIVLTHKPTVILVVGVNGSGKTTSIAKLAPSLQATRQARPAGSGRHLPRRRRRSARDLGPAQRLRHRAPEIRRGSGRGRLRRGRHGQSRAAWTSYPDRHRRSLAHAEELDGRAGTR